MNLFVLGILLSFASPLLLWPIEQILPWPFIIEEMVKAIVVIMITSDSNRGYSPVSLIWPIIAGSLFTLSETVFYLFNFLKIGDFSDLPKRIVLTGCLHIGTTVLIFFGAKTHTLGLLTSFILAVIIHYIFNIFIVTA